MNHLGANYFRHGVSKRTFSYLDSFAWRRSLAGCVDDTTACRGRPCADGSCGVGTSSSRVDCVRPFDRSRRRNAHTHRPLQPLRGHEHGPIIFVRRSRLETAR
ncbi:MAG: hypothetical protein M3P43_17525 [Actinomycetota bacterium]|nr:hypothetical protein [Actinomycetota bacterium]